MYALKLVRIAKDHEVIKDIISAYPLAASVPDPFGTFPLHLSLRAGNRWDTGVKEIFEAAPNKIHVRDHSSGLLPFMIAASKKYNHNPTNYQTTEIWKEEQIENILLFQKKIDLLELTTVFELLQKNPSQVIVL